MNLSILNAKMANDKYSIKYDTNNKEALKEIINHLLYGLRDINKEKLKDTQNCEIIINIIGEQEVEIKTSGSDECLFLLSHYILNALDDLKYELLDYVVINASTLADYREWSKKMINRYKDKIKNADEVKEKYSIDKNGNLVFEVYFGEEVEKFVIPKDKWDFQDRNNEA